MANDEQLRLAPASPHRLKSIHGRSGCGTYVRIRHPEGHKRQADEPIVSLGGPDVLGGQRNDVDLYCNPFSDTTCYLLDGFQRVVSPPSYSPSVDGGAWPAPTRYKLNQIQDYDDLETHDPTYVADSSSGQLTSSISGASPWTGRPDWSPCGGFDFTFAGFVEDEFWYQYVVPVHPSGMAGLVLGSFSTGGLMGVSALYGAQVRVASVAPIGLRFGTPVGIVPPDGSASVFVPSSLLPAAGSILYVGLMPNWMSDHGTIICGWDWPFSTGVGNSGRMAAAHDNSIHEWQSWDASSIDWGSPVPGDESGAWWGDIPPWSVAPTGGSYGINGSNLYLTVPAGSNEQLVATLQGSGSYNPADDDDESYDDPWTDPAGVNVKVRFRTVTAGSVTEAGLRYLRLEWHDGKDLIVAQVNLGDTVAAEGLTVSADTESMTVAKALAEGSNHWLRVDTRHPEYIRVKVWLEVGELGGGEPPAWDVVLDRADDSENPTTGDHFRLTLSAGNETGDDHSISVDQIQVCGAGSDCHWVQEKTGEGDAATAVYYTSQPYKPGSLWLFVDGFHVRAREIDPAVGSFRGVDSLPAAQYAPIIVRYLADLSFDDEDDE